MKKKISSLLWIICLVIPMIFCFSACKSNDDDTKDNSSATTYLVQFYNYDGVLIEEKNVKEGKSATCPTAVKPSSQYYVYEFANWEYLDGTDATSSLEKVEKTMIVRAKFNEVQPEYTVNFYDADKETLLDTETVLRGNELTFPTNLTKESDEYFNYSFAKWEDANGEELTKITAADGDVSVYITWTQTRHSCSVNFYDVDKSTLLKSVIKPIGTFSPTNEYKPTKQDWTFVNWYNGSDEPCSKYISVSNEINLYAYYAKNDIVENGITYKIDHLNDGSENYICYSVESTDNELVSGEIDLDKTFYSVDVLKIKHKAFLNNSNITKITIGNIKTIESGAFYNCPNIVFDTKNNSRYSWCGGDNQCLIIDYPYSEMLGLVYANNSIKALPDNVNEINSYAFTGCDSLEEIVLGENVNYISEGTFYDCKNLKKITISKNLIAISGDYASIVNDMNRVEIVIDNENPKYGILEWYDNDKTTLLKREIYRKTIDKDYYDVEKTGYSVFEWADVDGNPYEISKLGVINFNKTNLVKFYVTWVQNVTKGILSYKYSPIFEGYEVSAIDTNCATVEIDSEINGYPVTRIADSAFLNNANLTLIEIPNSVVAIGKNVVKNCSSLQVINLSKYITYIDAEAFNGCAAKIEIDDENEVYKIVQIYDLDNQSNLIKSVIWENGKNFTYEPNVSGYHFYYYANAEGEELSIGNISSNMTVYAKIVKSQIVINGITYLIVKGDTYYRVHAVDADIVTANIESTICGFDVKLITSYVFKNCTKLTTVIIPDSVTDLHVGVFEGCSELSTVTIGANVKDVGYASFENCKKLKTLIIDSATIANEMTVSDTYKKDECYHFAKTIYIKSNLTVSDSTYLLEKFTKQETSDKSGYDMYVRKSI